MVEEKMSVSGDKFCCPECKIKLQVNYTLIGDEENSEGIDDITIDEVQERIWFDGIEKQANSKEEERK